MRLLGNERVTALKEFNSNYLILGSDVGKLIIVNSIYGTILQTMEMSKGKINCIESLNDNIYFSGDDARIFHIKFI